MMKRKIYVGLDLGHYSIKAVQIERHAQGWKITRAAQCPTPQGAIREGVVSDPETVAGAIKQLMKMAGITAKHAVISVQGGSVVVRSVRIPRMNEQVLRRSIKYEAGRYVPTSVEDSYVEFEIIGLVDDAQMEILIVAAPNNLVDSRVQACSLAGLEVEVVDVGPFAAYRSLMETNDTRTWGAETFALIDMGSATTSVSVVTNGVFAMTRTVQNGAANLTEALRTFFDLTPEDAEQGKAQLDIAELLEEKPRENPPLRVLHPYIDEIVREVRRSINYYESQQVDGQTPAPVSTIVITGGGARLNGLDKYLADKLGLDVVTSGVFDNPRVSNETPNDFGTGAELAVASGLAMRPWIKAA